MEDGEELKQEAGPFRSDNIIAAMLPENDHRYGVALFVEKVLDNKKSENP